MEEKKKTTILETESLMHDMNKKNLTSLFVPVVFIFLAIAVMAGIGSGYFLAKNTGLSGMSSLGGSSSATEKIVGSSDTKTFKDIAEGVLEDGGIEGEGQFHLVRPGGVSQNVYLTSSTVDLSQFIKKKIKVWGETQKAQKAGWLMDVGRVEILQ